MNISKIPNISIIFKTVLAAAFKIELRRKGTKMSKTLISIDKT